MFNNSNVTDQLQLIKKDIEEVTKQLSNTRKEIKELRRVVNRLKELEQMPLSMWRVGLTSILFDFNHVMDLLDD